MGKLGLDRPLDWEPKGTPVIAAIVEQSCNTCRYFDRITGKHESKFGRCLRYPPQFVEYSALNGEWPVIKEDKWCGEHAEYPDVQRVQPPPVSGTGDGEAD